MTFLWQHPEQAHTCTRTRSLSLTHTLPLSPSLPPLCSLVHKHVSDGIHNRQKAKRRTESMPANMAEALKPVAGYSMSDGCQLERTCLIAWSVQDTSSKGCNTRYPSNCHRGTHPMIFFFCPSALFCIAAGTSWPVFCTTLLSPARWIFYEPGNVGFCVEDWNINMAVAPRAPLPALIQKLS